MLNSSDQENLIKSSQGANLFVQDLRQLVNSDNPLLTELAIEILQQAVLLEQKLSRLVSVTKT